MPLDSPGPLYVRARDPLTPRERGMLGARSRWGERRIARLDDFDPDERAAILAAIEAKRAAKTARAERESPEAA